MKFILSSLTLLFATSEAATIRKTMVVAAAQECNPNQAQFRMASPSSGCGPNSHCVLNGSSSLGGYCHDNDNPSNLDMPEAMQALCYVCESPDNADRSGSEVTDPDDIVGAFTCGELAKLGIDGEMPKNECEVFQRMIIANDSCGCSGLPAVADVEPSEEDSAKPVHGDIDASFDNYVVEENTQAAVVEKNLPGTLTDETSPFEFGGSGSSSKMIAIACVTSVVTFFLAF